MHTHFLARRLSRARARGGTVRGGGVGQRRCDLSADNPPQSHDLKTIATVDDVEYDANVDVLDRLKRGGFDIVHFNALHFLPIERAATLGAPIVAVLHTPPFDRFAVALRDAGEEVTIVSVSQSPDARMDPAPAPHRHRERGRSLSLSLRRNPEPTSVRALVGQGRSGERIASRDRRGAARRPSAAHRRKADR